MAKFETKLNVILNVVSSIMANGECIACRIFQHLHFVIQVSGSSIQF